MLKTIKESAKMEVQGKKVINNMQIETSQGTVYWQEDEPTNPLEGDTWFKVINGKAVNAYNRENGVWVEVEFSSQVIAEELIGKIITGAEINGGVINGTTMSGGEFINTYENYVSGINQLSDGKLDIKNGILQAESSYYLTDNAGTKLYKFANSEAYLNNASFELIRKLYNENGVETSRSSSNLNGGSLSMSLSEGGNSWSGLLDAKLLESMSTIKTKTVNIPSNSNVTEGSIQYSRWGQFVVATFYFNLLKTDVIGLAPLTDGYRPINTNMGTGVLASIAGPNRYCVVYAEYGNWRIIPGTQPVASTGRIRGTLVYLTNDSWQSAQVD